VLSDHERRTWNEIERCYAAEAEERARGRRPAPPWTHGRRAGAGVPAVAVGGVSIAVMFLLVGAPEVAVVIGGASALGWLLWRCWWPLGRAWVATYLPVAGGFGEAGGTGRVREDDASSGRPRRTSEAA